jgi:hypothetical protein
VRHEGVGGGPELVVLSECLVETMADQVSEAEELAVLVTSISDALEGQGADLIPWIP